MDHHHHNTDKDTHNTDQRSPSPSQASSFTATFIPSHPYPADTISHIPLKRPFSIFANDVERTFLPPPAKRQWHDNIAASRNPIHVLQLYCSNHNIPLILRSSMAGSKPVKAAGAAKMGRVWEAEVIVEGWYFKTKGVYYKSKREAERVVADAVGWWLVFGREFEEFERGCVYEKKEISPEVSIALASLEQMMQLVPLKQDINLGIAKGGSGSKSGQGKKKGKWNKSDPPKLEQPDLVFEGPVQASREVLEGRSIKPLKVKRGYAVKKIEMIEEVEQVVRYRR